MNGNSPSLRGILSKSSYLYPVFSETGHEINLPSGSSFHSVISFCNFRPLDCWGNRDAAHARWKCSRNWVTEMGLSRRFRAIAEAINTLTD